MRNLATLHTNQSRSSFSLVRSRPRIALASTRPAEVVRSGDDRRGRASLTPAPMRPRVPVPVSIYRPAGSAVQSGRANTKRWVLEFEPTSPPEIEPLMGWLASTDTQKRVRLMFPTRESAVAFADRHGWDYTVYEPRERTVRPKSYAEQFTLGITKAAA
jgi:ETC complex I subunit conserved region